MLCSLAGNLNSFIKADLAGSKLRSSEMTLDKIYISVRVIMGVTQVIHKMVR